MNDFRGADGSQQDDCGISPKTASHSLSYRLGSRLTQIGAFWCLADRCQRDFPASSDMQWTAMEGSKQSHGWLINDLCPLMVHPVLPQHLPFLMFAQTWSCSISQDPLLKATQPLSGSLKAHTAMSF